MSEARFTARMFMEFTMKSLGKTMEDSEVAPVVVVSWFNRVITSLVEKTSAKKMGVEYFGETHPLYTGEIDGKKISFKRVPVSAPMTASQLEELRVMGAKAIIGLGWAGGLQPSSPIGTMFIPTGCIVEEGTSSHYSTGEPPTPDEDLKNLMLKEAKSRGIELKTGLNWTTDAPYRELNSKIQDYRAKGVIGVDMETSAMYNVGKFYKIPVCNILIISDELWEEWNPHFYSDKLRESEEIAEEIILDTVRKMDLSE